MNIENMKEFGELIKLREEDPEKYKKRMEAMKAVMKDFFLMMKEITDEIDI